MPRRLYRGPLVPPTPSFKAFHITTLAYVVGIYMAAEAYNTTTIFLPSVSSSSCLNSWISQERLVAVVQYLSCLLLYYFLFSHLIWSNLKLRKSKYIKHGESLIVKRNLSTNNMSLVLK